MDEWHYQRGETTFGPISGVTLHSLIQRGRLQGDTRVKRSDMAEWSTVAQILPDLPTVPEAPVSSPELPARSAPFTAPTFDSSLPGAAVAYAPPQSAPSVQPQVRLPALFWFGFTLCAGSLLAEIACWISMIFIHLSGVSAGAAWPHALQRFAETLKNFVPREVALTSALVGMISTALWQGCAFASLRRLYGGVVRRSSASGLWWFVPIANLFKPFQCLRDMRYLSHTRRDVPDPRASFGLLLITLEAFILLRFSINVFERSSPSPVSVRGSLLAMQVVDDFAVMAFDATLLVFVISNFLQQRRLYAHWNDDAYWQNRSRH